MPLVVVPAAIVPALFALIFLVAWSQWGTVITNTLNINLPYIGNVIGNAVATVFNGTYAILVYWLDQYIVPLERFILAPLTALENTIGYVNTLGGNTFNALYSLRHTYIPAAIGAAESFAQTLTTTAIGYSQNLYNQSVAYATSIGAQVLGDAQSLYNQSVAYTASVGAALLGDAQSLFNQAVTYAAAADQAVLGDAEHLYNQSIAFTRDTFNEATAFAAGIGNTVEGDLAHAISALEAYAQQTATNAVGVLSTDIDNAISGALSGILTDVDGAVADVLGVIGTGDAAIRDALGRIDWTVPLDIAGVTALAGAGTLTMLRYLRDCGIPNCKNLGQFGRELQGVIGIVDDAALLAFLLELAHDPSGAAGLFESTVGAVIDEALSLGRSLLSA